MASLFRGYVRQLKARPVATNLGTAAVLMTAGDVMAQVIERWHLEDAYTLHDPSDLEGVPPRRRLHLRTYWAQKWRRTSEESEEEGEGEGEDARVDNADEHRGRERRGDGDGDGIGKDGGERSPSAGRKRKREEDTLSSLAALSNLALSAASDVRLEALRFAEAVDWTRTASMSTWAVAFYTPAYMGLYLFYDRIFPKTTAFTVVARVLGSVVYSVPVNAAFFLYGTAVHHTLEWIDLWEERMEDAAEEEELLAAEVACGEHGDGNGGEGEADDMAGGTRRTGLWIWWGALKNFFRTGPAEAAELEEQELQQEAASSAIVEDESRKVGANRAEAGATNGDTSKRGLRERLDAIRRLFPPKPTTGSPSDPPPFDAEMMVSVARLKIEMELAATVTNSAKMWIPINLFNFALVPAHLRPFGLLFFSVFWNCYLSLVQHRDLPLPEMEATKIIGEGGNQNETGSS